MSDATRQPAEAGDVVVVTGSSGLIGRAVCHRLAGDFRVVGFDRPGEPHPPAEADNVPLDLTDDQMMRHALEHVRCVYGERIASVVHLAAYYNFSGEPSPLYEQVTVGGTERLLGGLRSGGFQVGQFAFSSTMLVHAPTTPGRPIDEDSPLAGKWDYPASKIETERLIREQRGAIPAVMLRIAGVYDDTCHSIPLAHQLRRIYERTVTSRVFPGDLSHGQAFVHLEDVVEAIRLTVLRRAALPAETALLIGEPQTLSYDTLQREFAGLIHDETWETRTIPKELAKAGAWVQDKAAALPLIDEPFIKPWMIDLADDHYELDISRAARLLGWRPGRSLRATMPAMVAALRADPAGWYEEHGLGAPAGSASEEDQTPEQDNTAEEDKGSEQDNTSGAAMRAE